MGSKHTPAAACGTGCDPVRPSERSNDRPPFESSLNKSTHEALGRSRLVCGSFPTRPPTGSRLCRATCATEKTTINGAHRRQAHRATTLSQARSLKVRLNAHSRLYTRSTNAKARRIRFGACRRPRGPSTSRLQGRTSRRVGLATGHCVSRSSRFLRSGRFATAAPPSRDGVINNLNSHAWNNKTKLHAHGTTRAHFHEPHFQRTCCSLVNFAEGPFHPSE